MEAVTGRLREWGFEDLIKVFEDNAIDDEAFHLLDPDTIKDLIPSVGPRLKFLKHFKAFRGADQPAADNDSKTARERQRHLAPEGPQEIEDEEVRNKLTLTCFKCLQSFGNTADLFKHLKYLHNIHSGTSTHIICQCGLTFEHCKTYKRHVTQQHEKQNEQRAEIAVGEANAQEMYDSDLEFHDFSDSEEVDEDTQKKFIELLDEDMLLFLSQLKSKNIPEMCIQNIMQCVQEILSTVVGSIESKIDSLKDIFKGGSLNEGNFQEVQELCNSLKNTCIKSGIGTEYSRVKHLLAKGVLVLPEDVFLGISICACVNRLSGRVEQLQKRETFQYIPIADVFKIYLEQPGMMECILECNADRSNEGMLASFRDGEYFTRSFKEEGDMVLPILLYCDDFECANPLGSHKGVHKLCAFYLSVLAIPKKYQSTLSNILLVALAKSKLVEKYGIDSIMSVITADLEKVYSEGIAISTPQFEGRVRPKLFQVVADNLGLHTVLGFACGFTANFYCSECKQHREVSGKETVENSSLLRTREQFDEDLVSGNFSDTGLRRNSILNSLSYYHVTQNFARDSMHDFLEGIVPLVIKLVIKSLIDAQLVSLEELNSRILSFSYGLIDKKNRPSPITMSSLMNPKGPSGQKAAQAQCLLVYMCLLCGDKVPEENAAWEVLCSLLDVYKLVTAPKISLEATYMLKAKIKDHLSLYQEVFKLRLTPKQHFLVHYPRVIRLLGPLSQFSSMKFEAKHKPLKRIAKTCNNFMRIEKTVAKGHQMSQSYSFLLREGVQQKEISIQKQHEIRASNLPHGRRVCEILHITEDHDLINITSVEIHGYLFKPNQLLLLRWTDELPVFGEIKAIVMMESRIKLVIQPWTSLYFQRKYHAFAVSPSLDFDVEVVVVEDLADHRPVHAVNSYDKHDPHLYVPTRFLIA